MSTNIEGYDPRKALLVDIADTGTDTILELRWDRSARRYYRVETAPGPEGTEVKTICRITKKDAGALEAEIGRLKQKDRKEAALEDYEALEAQEDLYNRVRRGTEGLDDPFSMY